MKKQNDNEPGRESDDMAPEYDLKDRPHVRGKHSEAYQAGHELRIKETDGSTTVCFFTLEEGAVLLEPEVKAYFPDSQSVNRACRAANLVSNSARRPWNTARSRSLTSSATASS